MRRDRGAAICWRTRPPGGSTPDDASVLLTPYFHLAEVRQLAPDGAQVVPLSFVASQDAMRVLVELPADCLVGVLALDARRRRLLEAVVHQYSPAAVLGALFDDLEAAEGLIETADVVLATNAGEVPGHLAGRARRLVRVGWALESGGLSASPGGLRTNRQLVDGQ